MPHFTYTAVSASGRKESGRIEAPTSAEAQAELQARGLSEVSVVQEPSAAPAPSAVREVNAMVVAPALVEAVQASLPLAAGLRAMSEESMSRRTRLELQTLAGEIESGRSLQDALAKGSQRSSVLAGVVQAGLRSGDLPRALQSYVHLHREARDARRALWLSLAYPILLLLLTGVIVAGFGLFVVPEFDSILTDFDIELPSLTAAVLWSSRMLREFGLYVLIGTAVLVAVAFGAAILFIPPPIRSHLLNLIPIVGGMRRSFAFAHFCRLLSLLVRGATPLPEALRLAGAGVGDAQIEQHSERLASDVEAGLPLPDAARRLPGLPGSMLPTFRWHERGDAFADSLDAAADGLVAGAQAQIGFAAVVVEPAAIMLAGMIVGICVVSLFLPLVTLLNALS